MSTAYSFGGMNEKGLHRLHEVAQHFDPFSPRIDDKKLLALKYLLSEAHLSLVDGNKIYVNLFVNSAV
jgi:hypothetical protein